MDNEMNKIFKHTYDEFIKGREISEEELDKIKNYIAKWFLNMYHKDAEVLKEMAKSDNLLKMIQREFRFSKLLD